MSDLKAIARVLGWLAVEFAKDLRDLCRHVAANKTIY